MAGMISTTTSERCKVHESVIDMYQDAKDEWRWRIRSGNGSIIADSGEGYKNKGDALHGLFTIFFGAYEDSFLNLYSEWQQYKTAPNDLAQAPAAKVDFEFDPVEAVDKALDAESAHASVEGENGTG